MEKVLAIFIIYPIFHFCSSLFLGYFAVVFSLTWFTVNGLFGKGYFKCYFVVWLIASLFTSLLAVLDIYYWWVLHNDAAVFLGFMLPIVMYVLYIKLFDKVKDVEAKTKKVEKELEKRAQKAKQKQLS